jgi:hypothetical protein
VTVFTEVRGPDSGGVSSTWVAMAAVLALIGCGIGAIILLRRSFT